MPARMKLSGSFAASLVHSILLFLLFGKAQSHTVYFYIANKCPFPIWPATAPNSGRPVIADGGFYLPAGQIRRIQAPWTWSGRIWARTSCNFPNATAAAGEGHKHSWNPACETGDCDGRLTCGGLVGTPPATLVQVSLQGGTGKPNFYDVSLVDGYNLPVSMYAKPPPGNCSSIGGCFRDLNKICPRELRVQNGKGEVVACKSACLAFDLDVFCCRNEYGSPEKCKPNAYSKLFKAACPYYYSYAFDAPPPLVSCAGEEYVITFCPSRWGGDEGYLAM